MQRALRGGLSGYGMGSTVPPPLPSIYPGLKGGRGMAHATWQGCVEVLRRIYNLTNMGTSMASPFRELPDRDQYPDYYRVISDPETLDHVALELGNGSYDSPEAFFKQLHLVFLNAKRYNEQDTEVYRDATRLEEQMLFSWQGMATQGLVPAAHEPQHHSPMIAALPKRRGRPPKDPNKIAANAQAMAAAMAARSLPAPIPTSSSSSYGYDSPMTYVPNHVSTMADYPSDGSETPPVGEPFRQLRQGAQSEADKAVVASLDARLPLFPGPVLILPGSYEMGGITGSGWWGEGAPDYEKSVGGESSWPRRMKAMMTAIHGYRDRNGTRLAEVFDSIPTVVDIPFLFFKSPLSFESIRINVEASRYRSLSHLDLDMFKLFEKARRYHSNNSAAYGQILVLQRLYNALSAPYPLSIPPSGIPEPSPTLFASLPVGPGNARPVHETTQELRAGAAEDAVGYGVTTFRVGSKDRIITDEARFKGMAYKVGDFVHLINPDDATKPIVGQVFKTFIPTNKEHRTHHVTVCWYYRPEQTVHPADQLFYDKEIFKTGHFCDHPVQDIIERVSVQFYVKAIRGRPQVSEYYPGWPIYICNSRFNDRDWLFVRIKNWNSCIPDELRQTNFMNVEPFDRQIELGVVSSPFMRGITGPGHFGEPKAKAVEEEDDYEASRRRTEPIRRPTSSYPLPLNGTSSPYSPQNQYRPPPIGRPPATASASPYSRSGPIAPPSTATSNVPTSASRNGYHSESEIVREHLPPDTIKLFERDARGQVLWFSGPPIPPGSIAVPEQPSHSLEYLSYLVKKKKGELDRAELPTKRLKADEPEDHRTGENGVNGKIDEEVEVNLDDLWWTKGLTEDQVLAALKGVMDGL